MNIVVLDGHTLNPSDLSWLPLENLGSLTVYPRSTPDDIVDRAYPAQILLVNKVKMDASIIDQLPQLQYIGILATGFDQIDVQYASEKGIVITNIPAYGTASVAQHTFALMLELTNRVGLHNRQCSCI